MQRDQLKSSFDKYYLDKLYHVDTDKLKSSLPKLKAVRLDNS